MLFPRRLRVTLLAACVLAPTALSAGSASAATVPLNGRTFDAACSAAAAGDVITVPAGSYGSQTIKCTKAVTLQGAGVSTRVDYLNFSAANGPTVTGMRFVTGLMSSGSTNVAVKSSTINNQTYIENTNGLLFDRVVWEPESSSTLWENGDMVDIFPDRNNAPNRNITIQNSTLHGLRSPTSTSHSDAIQLYNNGQPHTGIKLLRNKFYDNECINLRTNPGDDVTIENNSFGDAYKGISGCGFYAIDVGYANVMARNNVFPGTQQVQETPTTSGIHQTWIGNAGAGFSAGCGAGGATGATMSKNVWVGQKCGSTDKQVTSLKVNSDGSPQSGSPLVDAGDTTNYPATDVLGNARYAGLAPDAGAWETGSVGTPPPPPADTTPPNTTISSAPANGTSTSASVAFSASESGSRFECKLDAAAYAACVSPKAYSGLGTGSHTVSVRAIDAAGNVDASPATASWTVSATAPPATPIGLVAAYGFSETTGTTVTDVSNHGLNGVRSGAVSTTAGKHGRALSFDGDKDQVTVADNSRLDLTNGMTLEAWVLPSTTTGWRTMMVKEKPDTGLAYGMFSSSDLGRPSGNVFTTAERNTSPTAALSTTQWTHLTVTYNGSSLIVYVNGVAASTRALPGPLTTTTGALRLGGSSVWGEWFSGRMDDVRIYDKALGATQIQTDMNTAVA
jgi:hypothetical protein